MFLAAFTIISNTRYFSQLTYKLVLKVMCFALINALWMRNADDNTIFVS